ncbi:hypothetical protein U1Q18_005486 [Sarracenia purpurea var. burkii]
MKSKKPVRLVRTSPATVATGAATERGWRRRSGGGNKQNRYREPDLSGRRRRGRRAATAMEAEVPCEEDEEDEPEVEGEMKLKPWA